MSPSRSCGALLVALGCALGCQARAVAIIYVGDAGDVDASAGGSAGNIGAGGSAGGAGSSGDGARAGDGGAPDAGVGGSVDGGAGGTLDAGPDATLPDADLPDGADPDGDVPPTEHCKPASDWAEIYVDLELELLAAVNERRVLGIVCDGVAYDAVPALTLDPELRCSARLHAKDMAARGYFSLVTPDGVEPRDRMLAAGWQDEIWGENIFGGDELPAAVVGLWISAGGAQCRNLVNPRFVTGGIGRFEDRWVLDLGGIRGGAPSEVGTTWPSAADDRDPSATQRGGAAPW